MNGWSRKNLGDAQLAGPELDRVAARVKSALAEAGPDGDLAAFVRHESDGRLHCEVVVYFSPAALGVARELGASPCLPPAPGDLGVLAGRRDAQTRLFPPE